LNQDLNLSELTDEEKKKIHDRLYSIRNFLYQKFGYRWDNTEPEVKGEFLHDYGDFKLKTQMEINKLIGELKGNGSLGLKSRVMIMWYSYTWVWGIVGVLIGGALTIIIKNF